MRLTTMILLMSALLGTATPAASSEKEVYASVHRRHSDNMLLTIYKTSALDKNIGRTSYWTAGFYLANYTDESIYVWSAKPAILSCHEPPNFDFVSESSGSERTVFKKLEPGEEVLIQKMGGSCPRGHGTRYRLLEPEVLIKKWDDGKSQWGPPRPWSSLGEVRYRR